MDVIKYNSQTQEVSVIVHSIDTDTDDKLYNDNKTVPFSTLPISNGINGICNHESAHKSVQTPKSAENYSKHGNDNEVHCADQNKIINENNDKFVGVTKGSSVHTDDNNPDIISTDFQKCLSYKDNQNTQNDNKLNAKQLQVTDNILTTSTSTPDFLTTSDVIIPLTTYATENSMTITKRNSSHDNVAPNNELALVVSDTEPAHTGARVKMLTGFILTCVSALFFAITTVIVKYVKDVDPGEMACIRFFWILLFSFPVMLESKNHPFGPSNLRHWLIIRGLAGATSLYFRYCALQYLPIGDATVIILSMPIFVCIFARIFLKEPCGIFHCVALVVTLTGIAFTTKLAIIFGSSEEEIKNKGIDSKKEIIGLAYSMGATLVGSGAYIIVRKLKGVHHSVILFNFSWVAILELSTVTVLLDGFTLPKGDVVVWLLCLLGLLSFYGQLLLTKALQNEEAGIVSVTRASTEVIYAFIFQILIFREIPDVWSIIGAVLVTISVSLISSRKWVESLPRESSTRKALDFITK